MRILLKAAFITALAGLFTVTTAQAQEAVSTETKQKTEVQKSSKSTSVKAHACKPGCAKACCTSSTKKGTKAAHACAPGCSKACCSSVKKKTKGKAKKASKEMSIKEEGVSAGSGGSSR